jgi:hypothetical protein
MNGQAWYGQAAAFHEGFLQGEAARGEDPGNIENKLPAPLKLGPNSLQLFGANGEHVADMHLRMTFDDDKPRARAWGAAICDAVNQVNQREDLLEENKQLRERCQALISAREEAEAAIKLAAED